MSTSARVDPVQFFSLLKQSKGKWADKPLELLPWQGSLIREVFDTLRPDGKRQYREVFVFVPRKNGKSTLSAAIATYMLFADGEQGAEIYCAASDREQASIVFDTAAEMVRREPTLAEMAKIIDYRKRIEYPDANSFFRAIPADAEGSHGYNASCVIIDELHAIPKRDLVDVLTTSTASREEPLVVYITTAGYDRQSICYEKYQYAKKVAAGEIEDPTFLPVLFEADEPDDFTDPGVWAKANPSFGVTVNVDYLEKEAKKAERIPGYQNTFRRLHLNQWTDADAPWIDGDLWRACEVEDLETDHLSEEPCYLALDLSSKRDLTALAAVWAVEDGFTARVWAWTPADTLLERERVDQVPYGVWVREGHLEAVPGRTIDYAYVARKVAELSSTYNLAGLAFDQWRIDDFQRELDAVGLDNWIGVRKEEDGESRWVEDGSDEPGAGLLMMRHGQGTGGGGSKWKTLWMPDSIGALEDAVLTGTLKVRKNPVLTWGSASAVLFADAAGNRKWEKRKSTGRIDAVVALSMALGLAQAGPDPEPATSVYESHRLFTVG